ncbi:MAG: hypothetical protein AAGA54_05940 [Myxococcota bacterium]
MDWTRGLLLGAYAWIAGCQDDPEPDRVPLSFEADAPVVRDFVLDTDYVEVAPGVQARVVTTLEADFTFVAEGEARGTEIRSIADSGRIGFTGSATVEVFARVDDPPFDDLIGTEQFTYASNLATFSPYLVDDPQSFLLDVPATFDFEFELPGLVYSLEMGMLFLPTYEGACLEVDEEARAVQYTMQMQPVADFVYRESVAVVTPLGRTTLGEVDLSIDNGDLGRTYDAGTLSLDDGAPLDIEGPCPAVDPLLE